MIQLNARKMTTLFIALVLVSFILSACGAREPEIDIEAQKTGFAQTADAQATMTVAAQPTATKTPEPTVTYTPTQEPTATPTVEETEDETETETDPAQPTSTPITGIGSDAARWMANDPPDKTNFSPGEEFTVIWTLENAGTSTWSTGFYIQFADGAQMGAEEKVFIPYPVSPTTNVQISVDFIAPADSGEYQSNWKLVNANDVPFYDFYVIIDVVAPGETEAPTATITTTPEE